MTSSSTSVKKRVASLRRRGGVGLAPPVTLRWRSRCPASHHRPAHPAPVTLGRTDREPPRRPLVPDIAPLSVQVIATTQFQPPAEVPWSTDTDGGQALAEFAGRACYQSWSKPNPATATNAGYLAHILEVGHLSVLEHGTVT